MIKKICDVVAIVGNVLGAACIAILGTNAEMAIIGYSFFITGSISAIYLLKHSNASKSLLYINYFFLVVNVVGILVRVPSIL